MIEKIADGFVHDRLTQGHNDVLGSCKYVQWCL